MTFVTDFLAIVGAWLTGIWGMLSTSIESAVLIFFDGTNVTTIGVLALFGLAMTLTMLGLQYVSRLIKK